MIITLHGSSNTLNSQGAYDFTNHIKSSLDIEPNSSIALVNATVERLSELIIGGVSGSNGTIKMEIDNATPTLKELHIPSGIYNTASLASTLESVINSQFSQHGYTFYVSYDKKADKFSINWHQGEVRGSGGKPKFAHLQTELTQSISGTGTKISIANGTTLNQWYMGRSEQKLPDYRAFAEPTSATSGIFMNMRLNLPNDAEMIMGVTGVEAFPSPNHNQLGCFSYRVKQNGHIQITEGRLGDTEMNYITGNNWTEDTTSITWELYQYHGVHGYDYLCVGNDDPATHTVYIKKLSDGTSLQKSSVQGGTFDKEGTLSADLKTITWTDVDGTNPVVWTSPTGAKLSSQTSKVVYSKALPLVAMNGTVGSTSGGGKICASWGSAGFVKYWFRNATDSHWSQIHISSSDRVPVDEMFGSGLGLMEYVGIRHPITYNAVSNNIFQMKSIISASLDTSPLDLKDSNVYKQNEATYTPVSSDNPINKLVMGTTNPSQLIMRNDEQMFLDMNAIPKGTFGIFTFIVGDNAQDQPWTIGFMPDNLTQGITATGSNRDLSNMVVGVQHYDSGGGVWGIKAWFNNAQAGNFRNYGAMGDNPMLRIELTHTGSAEVSYSKKADGYKQIYSVQNASLNVGVQNNFLPMIRSTNTNAVQFTNLKIETEKLTQKTGLVHFDAYQMSDVLGMTNSVQASDDGQAGFISSNKPDVEPEECDNPTIHLQLKNMPILSLNGHTSRTEKTLAVIPRYTSDEHSAKGLESVNFYEPNNLIYKSFNNPRKMALNSINVQLTNNDGSLAKDISCFDCTLDIRPTGY